MGWWLIGLTDWATVSGLAGVALQKYVPTVLANELRVEAIYERIPELAGRLQKEADTLVAAGPDLMQRFYADAIRADLERLTPSWAYLAGFRAELARRVAPFDGLAAFLSEPDRVPAGEPAGDRHREARARRAVQPAAAAASTGSCFTSCRACAAGAAHRPHRAVLGLLTWIPSATCHREPRIGRRIRAAGRPAPRLCDGRSAGRGRGRRVRGAVRGWPARRRLAGSGVERPRRDRTRCAECHDVGRSALFDELDRSDAPLRALSRSGGVGSSAARRRTSARDRQHRRRCIVRGSCACATCHASIAAAPISRTRWTTAPASAAIASRRCPASGICGDSGASADRRRPEVHARSPSRGGAEGRRTAL